MDDSCEYGYDLILEEEELCDIYENQDEDDREEEWD